MAPIPRRVREIMTSNPRTVNPTTHITEAYSLMTEGGFRHLVVIEGDRVVGMLSDRDILRHMPPPSRGSSAEQGRFAHAEVGQIMGRPALTIAAEEPIETAVDLMLAEHISALAVTHDDGRLVGVVTLVDLARFAGWLVRSLPVAG